MSAPELWDVYDAERRLTGRTIVRGAPLGPDDYVVVANVWMRNASGQWLVTKRSAGKSQPFKWEPPGGHVQAGETSLEAAVREVYEETGIRLNGKDGRLFASYRRTETVTWENPGFVDIWVFPADVPLEEIVLQPEETCEACWATEREILAMIAAGKFVPIEAFPYYRELFDPALFEDQP